MTEIIPSAVAMAGQENVNPAALPLEGFLDEVISLITQNPIPDDVVVEAARRLRWTERGGTYAGLMEARSQYLSTRPGR